MAVCKMHVLPDSQSVPLLLESFALSDCSMNEWTRGPAHRPPHLAAAGPQTHGANFKSSPQATQLNSYFLLTMFSVSIHHVTLGCDAGSDSLDVDAANRCSQRLLIHHNFSSPSSRRCAWGSRRTRSESGLRMICLWLVSLRHYRHRTTAALCS